MSMEAATQRLNLALGALESKVLRRMEDLAAENSRLRQDHATLATENAALREALAEARQNVQNNDLNSDSYRDLLKRHENCRTTLTRTLENLDSLISRVESAAK